MCIRDRDRTILPGLADPAEPADAIIRRHDRRRIEACGIDQPQPQLPLRPAAAGSSQIGGKIALERLLRPRHGMAERTGVETVGDDAAAPLHVAGRAGERLRDRIAHHGVATQLFGRRDAGRQHRCQHQQGQPPSQRLRP